MKFKKILPQFLTLLFIVLIFGFFTMNAQENMDTRGIQFGFGFLSKEASFDIQFSLIDYDGSMSYGRAYLVGLLNTLLVSFIGIILCTLLGAVVGVARLSPNYLIRKTASFYIEFFRNVTNCKMIDDEMIKKYAPNVVEGVSNLSNWVKNL